MDWFSDLSPAAIGTLTVVVSVLTIVGCAVALPFLLVHIPRSFLVTDGPMQGQRRHPVLRILRNLLGFVVFAAGVAMLVLPGQGLLTMLAGLLLMEFPGKHRIERRLLSRPGIFRMVNALRRRVHAPPLDPPLSWGPDERHRAGAPG